MVTTHEFMFNKLDKLILFQFGKSEQGEYVMDSFYPFTPMESFSIVLSIFETYDKI